jgi:cytochrome c biogenesis protein CcmG/thiol:disulfide interchange protein DsbE
MASLSVRQLVRTLSSGILDMKRSFLRWFVILSLCGSGLFFLFQCSQEKSEPTLSPAPDFALKTLDGREVVLSKLKGKVILLDFWATWCGPCRESIPHLIHLYKTYQKDGLEVIGMNVDRGDINTVKRFVNSMDIPYSIISTPEDVARNFGITGLPTAIIIDKQGKIREKISGFTIEMGKQMAGKVADLLSEKP